MGAIIRVVGVGGAGNNAVNRMIESVEGVEFIAINTDAQDLEECKADPSKRLVIGPKLTGGLGAGGNPSVGQSAAEESKDQIREMLRGSHLVFITAGMGGGTGTGASPVVAMIARELGILTVGVVTKPFKFEGKHKMRNAEIGIANLSRYVDCAIIVPNQQLVEKTKGGTTMLEAFGIADEVLQQGVQCITDLIVKKMTINIDFADIKSVMCNSGIAHMGIGRATGEDRLLKAIQQAVHSHILETTIEDASQIIMSITGGTADLSIHEVDNYGNLIRDVVDENCNIIFGADIKPEYDGVVQVIIIATGFPRDDKTQMDLIMGNHQAQGQAPQTATVQGARSAAPVQAVKQPDIAAVLPAKDPYDDLPPYIRKMRQGK